MVGQYSAPSPVKLKFSMQGDAMFGLQRFDLPPTFLHEQTEDAMAKWTPFFSKYGLCYTMRPSLGKRLGTSYKDKAMFIKLQPGTYTVMIHDPRMLPIRYAAL